MAKKKRNPRTPPAYKKAFQARMRAARLGVQDLYPTVREFEKAMGLDLDAYKQYESRSMLPVHLIEQFCRLTGVSAWYLLTGKSDAAAPSAPDPLPQTGRRQGAA